MQVSDPRRLCGVNRSAGQVSRPYRRSQGLTPTHKEVHTPACVRTSAAQGTHACAHSPCSIQTFYTCTPEPSGWGCLLHVYTFPAFLQRIIQSSIVTSIRIIYTQSTPGPMQFTKNILAAIDQGMTLPRILLRSNMGLEQCLPPSVCLRTQVDWNSEGQQKTGSEGRVSRPSPSQTRSPRKPGLLLSDERGTDGQPDVFAASVPWTKSGPTRVTDISVRA